MLRDIKIEEIEIIFLVIIPAILSFLLIPWIKKLSYRLFFLDKPNYRKLQEKPLPNLGGLAIFISYLIGIIHLKINTNIYFENFNTIIISSFGVLLIGLLDDLYNLSPLIRLVSHFCITSFIWSKNINISYLNFEYFNFGINSLKIPNFLSLIVTFFWFGGIINAINWIDGINGLASGVAILILIGIAKIAFAKDLIGLAFISLILIGACLGFMVQNLRPNNIIMGDNGSNFLGFQLSILSLYVGSNNQEILFSSNLEIFPVIPVLLMGFPLLDMVRVIVKRILSHNSPFFPDRNHFHHMLLDNKISNKNVLILIFSLTFYLITFSFLFTAVKNKIIIFTITNIFLLIVFLIFRGKVNKIISKLL